MDSRASSSINVSFPYPNTTNVSNFVNVTLDPTNYRVWEDQILNLINSQGFRSFVNGTVSVPPKSITVSLNADSDSKIHGDVNPEFLLWERPDKLLKGWITSTQSKEIAYFAVGTKAS